ncbi:MAG: hypothetical protein JW904_08045 [Spirochaetales bacterium]|nr:hypothetical protein [Spirochaetales bacterium]
MKKRYTVFSRVGVLIILFIPIVLFSQPIDMDQVEAREEFRLGVGSYHLGFFGKALQSFTDAERLAPRDTEIRTWLARTYFRLGLEDTALSMWREIIAGGKPNPLLSHTIQVVDLRRGLGRELYRPQNFVVNYAVNSALKEYHDFKRPSAVQGNPDGTFLLSAYGSNEVVKFNVNTLITGIYRGGIQSMNHPFDIIKHGNNFFVSEFEGDKIVKYDQDFVNIGSFGERGIGNGQLLGPQFLAIDENDAIYVTDWGNRRISKYDMEGNFILSMGRKSPLFPEMNFKPTGIAVRNEEVFVADQFKKQIAVFDIHGNYLRSFGEDILSQPEGIAFFDDNTLLVADTKRILAFDCDNEVWSILSDLEAVAERITDITVTANNDILAIDFDANKVFIVSETTSLISGYFVQFERIDAAEFPRIKAEISVEDLLGNPVVGLTQQNFFITEDSRYVRDSRVEIRNTDDQPLSAIIVVEDSPEMDQYEEEIKLAINNIIGLLGKNGRLKIMFARGDGILEADYNDIDHQRITTLVEASGTENWSVDRGLRAAAGEMIPSRGRRAVIYLTSATMNNNAFSLYSLNEVARYYRNNHVMFYPVYFGMFEKNREIEYLCTEAGGKSYLYFDPDGLTTLLQDIEKQAGATYLVSYISPTNPDFGKRFIPADVQVVLHKKSGRDESGYYPPRDVK